MIGKVVLELIIVPLALLFALIVLLIMPFDYFRYNRTQFYKDTGKGYFFTASYAEHVKLYDAIKEQNLPIDYHPYDEKTGVGYFTYGNALIFAESPFYDEELGDWVVTDYGQSKDEVSLITAVEQQIKKCNQFFKEEKCSRAILFVHERELKDCPVTETELYRILGYTSWRNLGAALEKAAM